MHKNGVNVLGIGDTPFENLQTELKNSLTEYYFVENLQDYEKIFKAVEFFNFEYEKIDWLEQDAKLRTEFHITTGKQFENICRIKNKSVFGIDDLEIAMQTTMD